ncbi:MAG TPA: RagB/SusD family nutrient uptake outer membrane protein, partial [Puia sp.]|nr:RagB/SusD family nutrient uptake outer membrane protein [Puia sp.]
MKRVNFKLVLPACLVLGAMLYACSKSFLSKPPQGTYGPSTMATRAGVEGLLIGAYSMLDGNGGAGTNVAGAGTWVTAEDNWVWGGVCADDAHKGSDPGDQPEIVPLMQWNEATTNGWLDGKWSWGYDAIQRSNDVLRYARLAKDMTAADTTEVTAEAKFLRAHYHMDLKKIFNQIPFVDENITYAANNWRVDNTVDAWPMIEADLQYAMANLPNTQSDVGRVNHFAAEAYLAKAYMFEGKFAAAQPLLADLINNGVTSAGKPYALVTNFNDNFNAATKNNTETVFAAQMSVND